MTLETRTRIVRACFLLVASMALALPALATQVTLGGATATFCQAAGGGEGPWPISASIDGSFSPSNGWAIFPQVGQSQVAVYKAATDIGVAGTTGLTFNLHMLYGAGHMIGKIRLAVTTSDRGTYGLGTTCADPNPSGSAVWIVLQPQFAISANGQTLTVQPDGSILASGSLPATDVVTVRAMTQLQGITGFRLEALTDSSLPFNGPGRQPTNGNFVLTEILLDASGAPVPTLGACAMALMSLLLGIAGVLWLRSRAA